MLTTEWTILDQVTLKYDPNELGFTITGNKSTGVVVKSIQPGRIEIISGSLTQGDHILQIDSINVRSMSSDQVASILKQLYISSSSGKQFIELIVARSFIDFAKYINSTNGDSITEHLKETFVENFNNTKNSERIMRTKLFYNNEYDLRKIFTRKTLPEENAVNEILVTVEDGKENDFKKRIFDSYTVEIDKTQVKLEIFSDENRLFIKSISLINTISPSVPFLNVFDEIVEINSKKIKDYDNFDSNRIEDLNLIDKNKILYLNLCRDIETIEKYLKLKWRDAFLVCEIVELLPNEETFGFTLKDNIGADKIDAKKKPQHILKEILPNGPLDRAKVFQKDDELIEINGHVVTGMSHIELEQLLKDLPRRKLVFVCKRNTSNDDKFTKKFSNNKRLKRTMSLELNNLTYWNEKIFYVTLKKSSNGFGFSLIDYTDEINSKIYFILRSLVPNGEAHQLGLLQPGYRLVSLDNLSLDNLTNITLDKLYEYLREFPQNTSIQFGFQKPLPFPQADTEDILLSMYAESSNTLMLSAPAKLNTDDFIMSESYLCKLKNIRTSLKNIHLCESRNNIGTNSHSSMFSKCSSEMLDSSSFSDLNDTLDYSMTKYNNDLEGSKQSSTQSLFADFASECKLKTINASNELEMIAKNTRPNPWKSEYTIKDHESDEQLGKSTKMRATKSLELLDLRKKTSKRLNILPKVLEKEIKIRKSYDPLGLFVDANYEDGINGCFVIKLDENGIILRDNRIQVGDYITYLNNENMKRITNSLAKSIIKRASLISNDITIKYIPSKNVINFKNQNLMQESNENASQVDINKRMNNIVLSNSLWNKPKDVVLIREPNKSLGISIVGGRLDVKYTKDGKDDDKFISGIFIKHVLDESPAGKSGSLRMGDRILKVNGIDLTQATHDSAIEIIKNATSPVTFTIQSLISEFSDYDLEDKATNVIQEIPKENVKNYELHELKNKYSHLEGELVVVQLRRSKVDETLGLKLSGNKDFNKTNVFVCEITPNSIAHENGEIQIGDEIIEINGIEIFGRAHSNVTPLIKNLNDFEFTLILLRNEKNLNEMYKPHQKKAQDTYSIANQCEVNQNETNKENIKTIVLKKKTEGFGIAISFNKQNKLIIRGLNPNGIAFKDGNMKMGDEIVAINNISVSSIKYDNIMNILQSSIDHVKFDIVSPTINEYDNAKVKEITKEVDKVLKNEPRSNQITVGKETQIEIEKKTEKDELGISIVGGVDTHVKGILIHDIYPNGIIHQDGRLTVGDQILEINNVCLNNLTHHEALSQIRRQSTKIIHMNVLRSYDSSSDKYDIKIIELFKKYGNGLGFSIIAKKDGANSGGVYVSHVIKGGLADKSGQLMIGDFILSVNDRQLDKSPYDDVVYYLKTLPLGKVIIKIGRLKALVCNTFESDEKHQEPAQLKKSKSILLTHSNNNQNDFDLKTSKENKLIRKSLLNRSLPNLIKQSFKRQKSLPEIN